MRKTNSPSRKEGHYYFITQGRRLFTRPVQLETDNPTECWTKIAAKAIAKRLETFLPNLIHSAQTGFVKGRYIGENIRLTSDVLDFTKEQKIPGILVALDFRKAFDSLEWPLLWES